MFKKRKSIVWIILMSTIIMTSGCSGVVEPEDIQEDNTQLENVLEESGETMYGPVYKLIYDEVFNTLLCFPALNQDAELTELYINDDVWRFQTASGEIAIGNIPKNSFDLKIVSYDKDGKIIGEVIYNNTLIYDVEGKPEVGEISEDTQYLIIYNNSNLKNIESLKNVKELKGLSIINGYSLHDISPIEDLTNLETLNLHGNQLINDISALENLTKLTMLSISGNSISDISALNNLDELRYLAINNNRIRDVSVLGNLGKLEWINMSGNKIKDITPLSNLTKIQYLLIGINEVEDYSSLDEAGIKYDN